MTPRLVLGFALPAALSLSACAMSLNGPSTGAPRPASSTAGAGPTDASSVNAGYGPDPVARSQPSGTSGTYKEMGQTGATYPDAERTSETARYDSLPPYLSAPADPWAGVAGDQPVRWSEADARHWKIRGNDGDCSALHDHCLVKDAWFLENEEATRAGRRYASMRVFGPESFVVAVNASARGSLETYVAYRTVPATKHNLVPGVTVVVLETAKVPRNGVDTFEQSWIIGTLDRVSWDIDKLYIVGREDSAWISAARIAVLSWRPGGKVEIMDGKRRDQLAVSAKDVILPAVDE